MSKEASRKKFLKECKEEFCNCYKKLKNRKIVLFGAGSYGVLMIRGLKDIGMFENIYAVCDNDEKKWGGVLEDIPIRSICDVMSELKDFIVVISSQYKKEICNSLTGYSLEIFEKPEYEEFVEQMLSFYVYKTTIINERLDIYKWIGEYFDEYEGKEERIFDLLKDEESKDILEKRIQFYRSGSLNCIKKIPFNLNQYFDRKYYNYIGDNEVFVDCGAYIGDTIEEFVKFVENKYTNVYAFEPDAKNFERLSQTVKIGRYQNINLCNCATGKVNGETFFNELGTTGSYVTNSEGIRVEVKCLDEFISDRVSWVKMDIEGAEYETLQGMEKLIKQYKPKLAICVYHKCEDIFRIPIYLHKLVPEYKFKLGQHHRSLYDTVLYADIYG